MTNREVARHFADGEPAGGDGNMRAERYGDRLVLWSYGTPIGVREGRWATFAGLAHSHSTAGHIRHAIDACQASDRVGHISQSEAALRRALREVGVPESDWGRLAA